MSRSLNRNLRNKLHKHIQLVFHKGTKEIERRKDNLFNKLDILIKKTKHTKSDLSGRISRMARTRVSINSLLHKNKKGWKFFKIKGMQ